MDIDPLWRAFKELQHLVVVVVRPWSIRVLDVTVLVLEADDPDDPFWILVLNRELARDPARSNIRSSLLLGISAKRVLLTRFDRRPHDRPVHGYTSLELPPR